MAFRVKEPKNSTSSSRTSVKEDRKISGDDAREKRHSDLKTLRKEQNDDRLQKRRGIKPRSSSGRDGDVDDDEPSYTFSEEQLSQACQVLMNPKLDLKNDVDQKKLLDALQMIRRDLSEPSDKSFVRIRPCLGRLNQLLIMNVNAEMIREIAWCLLNATTCPHELDQKLKICSALMDLKVARTLINMALKDQALGLDQDQADAKLPDIDFEETAVWTVANFIGDDDQQIKRALIDDGLVPALVEICSPKRKPHIRVLRQAAFAFSNLCRPKEGKYTDFKAIHPALPCLRWMLTGKDVEMVREAIWAVAYALDDHTQDQSRIEYFMKTGFFPFISKLLTAKNSHISFPALRCIAQISSGSDPQSVAILKEKDVVQTLLKFLDHKEKKFRKEVCWTLSNFCGGLKEHVLGFVKAGIVPPVLRVLKADVYANQKEALWILHNITAVNELKVRKEVFDKGAIPILAPMLKVDDPKVINMALTVLRDLLGMDSTMTEQVANQIEECGAMDLIESLQRHSHADIYANASEIIAAFFDGDDEEDHKESIKDSDELEPGAMDSMSSSQIFKF